MTSCEYHVVSNHRSFDCLFNSLYGPTSKKHQIPHYWPFVRGIHRWPVNSPHQGPVTRKKLPIDDVIMIRLPHMGKSQHEGIFYAAKLLEDPMAAASTIMIFLLNISFSRLTIRLEGTKDPHLRNSGWSPPPHPTPTPPPHPNPPTPHPQPQPQPNPKPQPKPNPNPTHPPTPNPPPNPPTH